jgi:hypothetical protein
MSGIDLLMNEVIVNETAGDNDVYRAVGRSEAIPDEFMPTVMCSALLPGAKRRKHAIYWPACTVIT